MPYLRLNLGIRLQRQSNFSDYQGRDLNPFPHAQEVKMLNTGRRSYVVLKYS
jgi:hypothetical protein